MSRGTLRHLDIHKNFIKMRHTIHNLEGKIVPYFLLLIEKMRISISNNLDNNFIDTNFIFFVTLTRQF